MWPFSRDRKPRDYAEANIIGFPTYDAWWHALGHDAGMPYDPPVPTGVVHLVEDANGVHAIEEYGSSRHLTGAFFYDKDLAQFGNAVSPFVQMDARDAHLAEQRRFEDRYDPKYFTDYDLGMDEIAQVVMDYASEHAPAPTWPETYVGWSQPPHPIDVVPSFDPRASARNQARAVLMDYYHDDPLRYWADNDAVKRCFGVKEKEDYDPALLVEAYENKNHKVWSCKGDKNTWKDLNDAVQEAIKHRAKLGPLPASSYDTDPIVIYYYDNDKMKRVTYPRASVPAALNPANVWWWKWGQGPGDDASKKKGLDDVHTNESDDPKKIADERSHPGYPGGGQWGSEGFTWDKDAIGVMGPLVGALLAIVSAVLDATGVGAAVGVPLAIATPFIVAAINAADTALHAGDFGAALGQLGPALIQAAANAMSKGAHIQIPPEAVKALGTTVTAIGKAVSAGQKKNLDFGQLWDRVAKKAGGFTKIGDAEAHTIAVMLGENAAGNVFIHGYEAGKLTDAKTVAAIAKIMEAMKQFSDPRIINLFLLGAGIGYLSKQQTNLGVAAAPAHQKRKVRRTAAHHTLPAAHVTQGDFTVDSPQDRLEAFVAWQLVPRYGLGARSSSGVTSWGTLVGAPPSDPMIVAIQMLLNELWGYVVGSVQYIRPNGVLTPQTKQLVQMFQQSYNVPPGDGSPNLDTVRALETAVDDKRALLQHWGAEHTTHTSGGYYVGDMPAPPEPDWSPLARGCPRGTWWDSLRGECRPIEAMPPRHAVEGEATTHFYAPRSEGAMLDLASSLGMSGESPKWIGRLHGVLFMLLWDGPDESARVVVTDYGHANLQVFWNHLDAAMAR